MTQIVRKVRPGASPGSLVAPPQRVEEVRIEVFRYDAGEVRELEVGSIAEAFPVGDDARVTWINVVGLHDVELLSALAEHFGLHPLALEDVVNVGQRPTMQEYEDHIFVVLRLPHLERELDVEQISIFFSRNVVISLQEIPEDPWDRVRERIRQGAGRIRTAGADYLAYTLMDSVIDSAYPVLERYGERIESLEHRLVRDANPRIFESIQRVKHALIWMRRIVAPHTQLVSSLLRSRSPLIGDRTRDYLRDLHDHCVQLMDVTDTFRELARGLTDLYMSTSSHRLNEVMKVLTIMASIFIPLTFIAGIYGMNFNPESSILNMPELNWAWGYPAVLVIMAVIAAIMMIFFKLKRWL